MTTTTYTTDPAFIGWDEDGEPVFQLVYEPEFTDEELAIMEAQEDAAIARWEREMDNFEVPAYWEP